MKNSISTLISVLCCCVLAPLAAAYAQPAPVPSEFNQPDNFSHLVGVFDIDATTDPKKEAFVDEPIELTVVITGSGPNKEYLPDRKRLRIFPRSMERDFYIGESPKNDKLDPDKGEWTFYYQLLPKHEKDSKIPSFQLTFYNPDPALPPEYRYQSSYSRAIPITIKTPPDVIVAPSRMYEIATGESLLVSQETPASSPLTMILVLVLTPIAAFAGFCAWRYMHPDSATQIKRKQSRAAQSAFKQLRRMGQNGSAAQAGDVVRQYLQQRFDFPSIEPTPRETMEHLYALGLSLKVIEQTMQFITRTHQTRFAPEHRQFQIVSDATALVNGLEAETL